MLRIALLLALLLVSTSICAQAPFPSKISFQGYLTDDLGQPVDSAGWDIKFSIYENGWAWWSETHSVDIVNGGFNVDLGDIESLARVDFSNPVYLGIEPSGQSEISPWTLLTGSPYALAMPGLHTSYQDGGSTGSSGYNVHGGESHISSGVVGATIGGGGGHVRSPEFGSGGRLFFNQVSANFGTVSGGYSNNVRGESATISGGYNNEVSLDAQYAAVGGGSSNTASGDSSTVAGGAHNTAISRATTVGGGSGNVAGDAAPFGQHATVSGGRNNKASAQHTTIGGGSSNSASWQWATVGGGENNMASAGWSTIGGGENNTASGKIAAIGGGSSNGAGGTASTTGGGYNNTASGDTATVGGGSSNAAGGIFATICGGYNNTASAQHATVSGGRDNASTGQYAMIPGGHNNKARGASSFAAGSRAKANHNGSFVWQGSAFLDSDTLSSTSHNQFLARASGGFFLYTGAAPDLTTGISLPAGSGTWTALSSESSKTNFFDIDSKEYLDRVVGLDLKGWSYKTEQAVTHVGPMSEDFYAAFGHGPTDKGISGVDADGVALAAIQGLYELVKELQAENARMREAMERAGIE
jgi:hypothetical protein